jgi:hypothetical protein
MGPPCGTSYKQRLLSLRLDYAWMPARDKRNYYDKEALEKTFGEDAEERMMEETEGRGPVSPEDLRSGRIDPWYTEGEVVDET